MLGPDLEIYRPGTLDINKKLLYAVSSGGATESFEVLVSKDDISPLTMAVDDDGTVAILYSERFLATRPLSLVMGTPGAWETTLIEVVDGAVMFADMHFDSQGTPQYCYRKGGDWQLWCTHPRGPARSASGGSLAGSLESDSSLRVFRRIFLSTSPLIAASIYPTMPISDAARHELERFDPTIPIERAHTPPASWYTSTELFNLEREAVFGRTWQPVARVAQVREIGQYVSGCLVDRPWVIVRDHDGQLRGFHNVCRHKGREVVRGAGTAEQLVCGYHAWTYDLAGRLRKAPQTAGIEAFDRAAMSLVPIRVETWGPWVFINADLDAASLAPRVTELDARLAASNWADLEYVVRTEWTAECNWKVLVDNYLDGGYHVPHMHPTLDAQLDMANYRTELFGEFSIQTCPSAGETREAQRIGTQAIYAWLFPNFMINRYGNCLDSNHVIPLGPDRSKIIYEFYFSAARGRIDGQEPEHDAARASIAESIEQSAITQREDMEICESVQIGLKSGSYDRGRYAPRVEHGEHHFHQLLARSFRAEIG